MQVVQFTVISNRSRYLSGVGRNLALQNSIMRFLTSFEMTVN